MHWRSEGRNKLFVKNNAQDDWAADFWRAIPVSPFNIKRISNLADSFQIQRPYITISKIIRSISCFRCWCPSRLHPSGVNVSVSARWKPSYSHRFVSCGQPCVKKASEPADRPKDPLVSSVEWPVAMDQSLFIPNYLIYINIHSYTLIYINIHQYTYIYISIH